MALPNLIGSEDGLDTVPDPLGQAHSEVYSPVADGLAGGLDGALEDFSSPPCPPEQQQQQQQQAPPPQPPPPPSSPTAPKRLACERCHNQKLRCSRQPDQLCCDRCVAANATCTERVPRRLGRPHSTGAAGIAKAAKKQRRHGGSESSSRAALLGGHHHHHQQQHQQQHRPAPGAGHVASAKGGSRKTSGGGRAARKHDLGAVAADIGTGTGGAAPSQTTTPTMSTMSTMSTTTTTPPPPSSSFPERRSSPWPLTGLLSPSDCPSPFDWSVGDTEPGAAAAAAPDCLDEVCHPGVYHPGPLMAGLGGLDPLMTTTAASFDAVSDTLLVPHPHVDDPLAIDTSSPATSMAQDPVERLANLNLELYQCLNSFRSLEHQGRVVGYGGGGGCEPEAESLVAVAALDWAERLFQAAEEFIEILRQGFVRDHEAAAAAGQGSSPASPFSSEPDLSGPDSATGLMVISCYLRLLQIFESFASVLPAALEAGCTLSTNLLGVRIGRFCPTVDRKLSTAFVVQYVYHLLDSICDAVEGSVGAQPVHGPTLVDARKSEARLRESISSSLKTPPLF